MKPILFYDIRLGLEVSDPSLFGKLLERCDLCIINDGAPGLYAEKIRSIMELPQVHRVIHLEPPAYMADTVARRVRHYVRTNGISDWIVLSRYGNKSPWCSPDLSGMVSTDTENFLNVADKITDMDVILAFDMLGFPPIFSPEEIASKIMGS